MNTITFNANGVKINGVHIHGDYMKNGKNGCSDKNVPKNTIIIMLDTYRKIVVPGLISQNESDSREDYYEHTTLKVMPNNRNYKEALKAYKKARCKQINKEIKDLQERIKSHPEMKKTWELHINRLEREQIKLK